MKTPPKSTLTKPVNASSKGLIHIRLKSPQIQSIAVLLFLHCSLISCSSLIRGPPKPCESIRCGWIVSQLFSFRSFWVCETEWHPEKVRKYLYAHALHLYTLFRVTSSAEVLHLQHLQHWAFIGVIRGRAYKSIREVLLPVSWDIRTWHLNSTTRRSRFYRLTFGCWTR